MNKQKIMILGFIIFIEIIIFTICFFLVDKMILQRIFGVFSAIWLIVILISFVLFKRSKISLQKSQDPISEIGEDKIKFYYNKATEVDIDDLVAIKKTENLKNIFLEIIMLLITLAITLIAFYL